MAKGELGWTRKTTEGEKVHVYVHLVGKKWRFYHRKGRGENWQPVEDPPLDDWVELFNRVKQMVARKRADPATLHEIRERIKERFPDFSI